MALQLKPLHKNLADLNVLISIAFCMFYGITFYHTVTGRTSYVGKLYKFYDVDLVHFAVYNMAITILSFSVIVVYNKYLRSGQIKKFAMASWLFGGLILILLVANVYFQRG